MSVTVCLARFHDGTAKTNWGGRATSLALAGLVDRTPGHRVATTLNGSHITRDFPEMARLISKASLAIKVLKRVNKVTARSIDQNNVRRLFESFEEFARALVHEPSPSPALKAVRASIAGADEFWMNGEGDFILYPRRSLLRTLIYMQMAIEMGKQVRLLNTILSPPPARASDPVVIQAVGRMIPRCAVVAYRDPESMRLHQELYSTSNAIWTPDALFTWWREGTKILGANVREAYYGPIAEGLPPEVQALLRDEAPIVAISGSSSVTSRNEDTRLAFQPIADLVTSLKAAGFQPVLVATCSGDDWMAKAAASADCPFVPARVPLVSGLLLMSRAKCFVSGRYHPSILASVVGAPVVLMASNSHKNLSLQQVMGHPDPREFPFFTQSADVAPLTEAVLAACETSADSRASLKTRMEQLERQVQTMTAPLPVSAAA